jgi:hypothetical protein
MIASEILDLEQFIEKNLKCNCHFGIRDNEPNQYPLVEIRMTEDLIPFFANTKTQSIDLPLDLHIIVDKVNEYKALEVLERLYQKINQFNSHKGHKLEDTATPEYVEDTKTFEINVPYTLKLIIQDT